MIQNDIASFIIVNVVREIIKPNFVIRPLHGLRRWIEITLLNRESISNISWYENAIAKYIIDSVYTAHIIKVNEEKLDDKFSF